MSNNFCIKLNEWIFLLHCHLSAYTSSNIFWNRGHTRLDVHCLSDRKNLNLYSSCSLWKTTTNAVHSACEVTMAYREIYKGVEIAVHKQTWTTISSLNETSRTLHGSLLNEPAKPWRITLSFTRADLLSGSGKSYTFLCLSISAPL